MGHTSGSFDYKVINPIIKQVLKARSELDNTVQVAMPFVKATTTIQIEEYLGQDNIGFTLGLHGIDEDVNWEDMFSEKDGEYPLVGYTYQKDGSPKRLYARPPSEDVQRANLFFDQGRLLEGNTKFGRIPPPGIVTATIGNYKNGLLASGELVISVPHISQLEYLHRTFLIPGVGMVLEWGQQFAPEVSPSTGEFFSPATDPSKTKRMEDHMFPWWDRTKLLDLITKKLAYNQIGMQEILEDYVYPTQGQYMWMFGRVANFTTNANADGSFECRVKIVGSSENAWAYSTRSTVIPATNRNNDICESDSIESFFVKTGIGGKNLKTLLDDVFNGRQLPDWRSHVQMIPQGNKSEAPPTEPTPQDAVNNPRQQPNVDQTNFGESEDAYFMTWRFFVNVVINHPELGLRSIFKRDLTPDQFRRISLLRPYLDQISDGVFDPNILTMDSPGRLEMDDPMESFVGYNRYLLSIDPSTLIIVNEEAATFAQTGGYLALNREQQARTLYAPSEVTNAFKAAGEFNKSSIVAGQIDNTSYVDRGFLSTGVWLNHKAAVEAMAGATTFLQGINNLLMRMNQATMGYWQLALDGREPPKNTIAADESVSYDPRMFGYTIIDVNWKGSSDEAVKRAITGTEPGLYVFNKYVRRGTDGKLVGSELIDCNIDLSLPKLMFGQIATLGLVQKEDLAQAGVDVSAEGQEKSTLISDPNETLRKMFSITTLSKRNANGQGPDLTYPPANRSVTGRVCSSRTSDVTAGTMGNNPAVGSQPVSNLQTQNDEQIQSQYSASRTWLDENQEACKRCPSPPSSTTINTTAIPNAIPVSNTLSFISSTAWSAAFITFVTEGTLKSAMHSVYAQDVKSGRNPNYIALNPATTTLQRGDILVNWRTNENGTQSVLTFDQDRPWSGIGHGDVVVRNDGNNIFKIGGNKNDSVRQERVSVDDAAKSPFFVVLRPTSVELANRNAQNAEAELNLWQSNGWMNERDPRALGRLSQYYASVGYQVPAQAGTGAVSNNTGTPTDVTQATQTTTEDPICAQCRSHEEVVRQTTQVINATERVTIAVRQFPYLKVLFRYIEIFQDFMVAKIRGDSDANKANAFGAAPSSLAIKADLTMPGINGIRVGELFWIDRIPQFYKAFGAFTILGIQHTIDVSGWKTQLNSTFYYLGDAWKRSVTKLLVEQTGVK